MSKMKRKEPYIKTKMNFILAIYGKIAYNSKRHMLCENRQCENAKENARMSE